MIIPLGPGSLQDSSSLPEGRSNALLRARRPFVRRSELRASIRAGPALPSYLALLHAGFSVPRSVATRAVGSYPTFSPLPNALDRKGEPAVLPWTCRRVRITPAVYFLWHFPWPRLRVSPSRNARRNPLALPGALPFRRRLLRSSGDGSPDFPPASLRPPCDGCGWPAIIQLTRLRNYTACLGQRRREIPCIWIEAACCGDMFAVRDSSSGSLASAVAPEIPLVEQP